MGYSVDYENALLSNLYNSFFCNETKTDCAISRLAESFWLQRNSPFPPLVKHKASLCCHSDASCTTHLFQLLHLFRLLHVVGLEVIM